MTVFAYSQILITEISYNPPESNQDTLEYIEIYNAGADVIDLSGYHFLEGVEDTVDAGVLLDPNAYYLFCESASAMNNVFGITADQWTDGALQNGGETITFADASGNPVASITFDDEGDWPTFDDGTDGEGASIVLCDLSADYTLASSWRASTNDLGIELNGRIIKGSPGAENMTTCDVQPPMADHVVEARPDNSFAPADITINVGETVQWVNRGGNHNVNGAQSVFPDNPESFSNGAPSPMEWTFEYTFNVPGVYNYQCDPHVSFDMFGTVTVMDEEEPEVPEYRIGEVNTTDSNGEPDSIGVECVLTGVVHSPNFRSGGLTFTIIDGNGDGIGVFSASDDFGYSVAVGDDVSVTGSIGFFNGLTQIVASNVSSNGTGTVFEPSVVTNLDESTESQLVRIEGLTYVDPAQWTGMGSGFNVDLTDGVNNYVIRIDNDIDAYNSGPIDCTAGSLAIIGIGGQFDNSSPYDEGYQLFPRSTMDFLCVTSTIDPTLSAETVLYPNPVSDVLRIKSSQDFETYSIMDGAGRLIKSGTYSPSINTQELNSGIYELILRVDNRIAVKRFMVGN